MRDNHKTSTITRLVGLVEADPSLLSSNSTESDYTCVLGLYYFLVVSDSVCQIFKFIKNVSFEYGHSHA